MLVGLVGTACGAGSGLLLQVPGLLSLLPGVLEIDGLLFMALLQNLRVQSPDTETEA